MTLSQQVGRFIIEHSCQQNAESEVHGRWIGDQEGLLQVVSVKVMAAGIREATNGTSTQ